MHIVLEIHKNSRCAIPSGRCTVAGHLIPHRASNGCSMIGSSSTCVWPIFLHVVRQHRRKLPGNCRILAILRLPPGTKVQLIDLPSAPSWTPSFSGLPATFHRSSVNLDRSVTIEGPYSGGAPPHGMTGLPSDVSPPFALISCLFV